MMRVGETVHSVKILLTGWFSWFSGLSLTISVYLQSSLKSLFGLEVLMYPFSVMYEVILLASTKKNILLESSWLESWLRSSLLLAQKSPLIFPAWWVGTLFPDPREELPQPPEVCLAFILYRVGYSAWAGHRFCSHHLLDLLPDGSLKCFPGFSTLCWWLVWHPGPCFLMCCYGIPQGWSLYQNLLHPAVFWQTWKGRWWTELSLSFLCFHVPSAIWSLRRHSRSWLVRSLMPPLLLYHLLRALFSFLKQWISRSLLLGCFTVFVLTFLSTNPMPPCQIVLDCYYCKGIDFLLSCLC